MNRRLTKLENTLAQDAAAHGDDIDITDDLTQAVDRVYGPAAAGEIRGPVRVARRFLDLLRVVYGGDTGVR